ncbi:MAG: response regulator [Oligoflexia bacterium]|nr:response regulator [Oligoflexia bacterium]
MSVEQKKQVLIVDDDHQVCDLIQAFLKIGEPTLKCVQAHDTAQATFKIDNQHFDLVIVDKNLPGKSGLEFVRQLRRTLRHQGKKVILVSAALEREDVLFAVKHNIQEILVKPFTFAQLMEKVRKCLPTNQY